MEERAKMEGRKKVIILIAHSGLEIIPKQIISHPQCQRSIELYNNSGRILDAAIHHTAMENLNNKDQRGRPDILQIGLLLLLNSPLANENLLDVYFSIQDGKHYKVSTSTRIPREGNRFKGLMFQLLNEGHIPQAKPYFIEKIADSHEEFLNLIKSEYPSINIRPILFSTHGKNEKLFPYIDSVIKSPEIPLFIVGGFQKGQISAPYVEKAQEIIAIYNKGLESWTIISRLISSIEQAFEII